MPKGLIKTTNQKYEITDIAHAQYPFLHRIRALRNIGSEVNAGEMGGFVESESNLSYEPDDDAWIFDNAIACNGAYVDQGASLRDCAVACDNAYISRNAVLSGYARAEDDSYIRGAALSEHARASGQGMILQSATSKCAPVLSGQSAVYGKVSGDVRLTGMALVVSGEEICNDTLDTLVISEKGRSVIRDPSRDELAPKETPRQQDKGKERGMSR